MLSKKDMRPYQRKGAQFIIDTPRCALFDDMGLGKTVSTLTALEELIESGKVYRVLIIAPPFVAKNVWPKEYLKWEHLLDAEVKAIAGTPAQRKKILEDDEYSIYSLSSALLQWMQKEYGSDWPFDMIVIDESSQFKNSDTKRFKALKKVAPKTARFLELTGTPAPNTYADLWAPTYLLDAGNRLGPTKGYFFAKYFEPFNEQYHEKPELKLNADKAIARALSDITLRREASDYLELPERINITHTFTMSPAEDAVYRELEEDYCLNIEGADVTAINAAALTGKLCQAANGAVYDDEQNAVPIHKHKIAMLREIYDSANSPLLVPYSFKFDLQNILKEFPEARTLSDDSIEAWNKGQVPMLIMHPASGGHGLNLQFGGNNVVWYGLPWSLELYQQLNARLHRQGQNNTVIVHHIINEGTVDEDIFRALTSKGINQKQLLDDIKASIALRSMAA